MMPLSAESLVVYFGSRKIERYTSRVAKWKGIRTAMQHEIFATYHLPLESVKATIRGENV